MDYGTEVGVVKIDPFPECDLTPSRICSICDQMEYKEAHICDGRTWICPSCAQKIGELIGVRTTKLYGDEL